METKPFSLQSPEQVAKDYGGNKQKIAQAAQMGTIDPTAAVLAGMFIDRMRSAQVAESAPQQTVAQQVLTPQPQMPMGAPPPQAGGLGATPPAMGMAPPPETPGMEAQQMGVEPQMGMAEGGIIGLDIPDGMYDEPSNGGFNDGFSGGGLVAFAKGGYTLDTAWNRIKKLEGGLGPNGEMRVSSAGAVGPSQLMPATAPEAARLAGLPWDEKRYRTDPAYNEALGKAYYASRVAARGGDYAKAALDYHSGMGNVDKGNIGPAGKAYLRGFLEELPEQDMGTAQGRAMSFEDQLGRVKGLWGELPDMGSQQLKDYYNKELSPEEREKARKDDMWMALANIGANMAASDSPFFFQSVGKALAETLPGVEADKKERKAAETEARKALREIWGMEREDQKDMLKMANEFQKTELGVEESQAEREARAQQAQAEMENRLALQKLQNQGAIAAAQARPTNPSDLEQKVSWVMQAGLAKDPMSALQYLKDNGYLSAQQQGGGLPIFGPQAQAGAPAGGQPNVINVGGWND